MAERIGSVEVEVAGTADLMERAEEAARHLDCALSILEELSEKPLELPVVVAEREDQPLH